MPQESYGRYRILRPLGQGGMASVHLAEDPVLRRVVAIKILRGELGTQSDWVRRFRDEATAIARLGSPNVVQVHDFGREAGEDYLVMEFVEGISLSQFLSRKAERLDPVAVAAIACQVADGLRTAHGAGIIHRDIKPDNILIRRDGQSKIADFGIARILEEVSRTMTGSVFGSPLFMAPEQVEGKNPSGAIDIFALGGVIFRALCGHHPFEAEHAHAVMWRIVQEEAPRLSSMLPDAPPELDDLVASMHSRDPSARPRASEVSRLLKQFLVSRGCGDPVETVCSALPESVVSAQPVGIPTAADSAPPMTSKGARRVADRPRTAGFWKRHRQLVPLLVSGAALILAAWLAGMAWDRMQLESIPQASIAARTASEPGARNHSPSAATVDSAAGDAAAVSPNGAPSPIQVLVRDEAPEDRVALRPRIALANHGSVRISWIRATWVVGFPSGEMPVLDVYYAPKCEARLEGEGSRGRLVVECSDLDLSPGQSWPGPDGLSLSIHHRDWGPWKGKESLGLQRQMTPRLDLLVQTR
jgi:serine/threonine-protein kinase